EKIAPTGADYEAKLAAIPRGRARRALAQSLLNAGRFDCKEIDEEEECGETFKSFKDLDGKAGIDDPCLRRHLAHWALVEGGLAEEDVRQIKPALLDLLDMPEPETDLPNDVMKLVDGMSPALRLEFLAKAPEALAEEHVAGLPQAALVKAAGDFH